MPDLLKPSELSHPYVKKPSVVSHSRSDGVKTRHSSLPSKSVFHGSNDVLSSDEKYKKLAANTLFLTVGQFSSKILVYVMIFFYTRWLGTEGYGTVNNIVGLCTLLISVVTVSIAEGVTRFTLDKNNYDNSGVLSNGILVTLAGAAVFFPLSFLLKYADESFGEYHKLISLYILTGGLNMTVSYFARSIGKVKLFAVVGIINTAVNILFNIIFLGGLNLGITGFILAVILGDIVSITVISHSIGIFRRIDFSKGKIFLKEMLNFSIPFVASYCLIWVINLSDGLFIKKMMSPEDNGIYQAAYKFPGLISIVSGIFYQAFNISANEETELSHSERNKFYSRVFKVYSSAVFLISAGLLFTVKPLINAMTADDFKEAYKVTPLLVAASVFTCFGQFLNSIYNVRKKSVKSTVTAAIGAGLNICLNFILIPKFGLQGAAFSTFLSYAVIFASRLYDTRNFVRLKIERGKFFLNMAAIAGMGGILTFTDLESQWYVFLALIMIAVILINTGTLFEFLSKFKKRENRI